MSYIRVIAVTGSKKEEVVKKSEQELWVYTKQKPERNMANKAIIFMLQEYFNTKNVRLINGHHTRSKLFSIE